MESCSIQCHVSDGAVCMLFPGGAHLDVPLERVTRSIALQDIVLAGSDAPFTFIAPAGFVQLWHDVAAMPGEHMAALDTPRMTQSLMVRTDWRLIRVLMRGGLVHVDWQII